MFEILFKQSGNRYYRYNEEDVCCLLEQKGFDSVMHSNGIPVSIEASSWCGLASIGEEWENDSIIISCIDAEN